MFKARVQLALIALVLGISGYLFLGNIVNETRPPLWKSLLLFLDGTFLVSAISILACTFIRAKQMADGSVCFMPNNPLVRFEFVGKKGTDICPTFWWVGFVIAWVAMTVSLVLLVIFVLVPNMISTVSSHDFRAEDGYFLLAAVGVFAGIAALIRFIVWLSEKEFWLCKVPLIVFGVSAIVAGLYILS
ncbi:MAG: hypothetical protein Q8R55_06610, partial [Candidatus Taylorbacteria bacterium]|nr:hypothetical protein [Candidatus Taylorbacteria bacterium]